MTSPTRECVALHLEALKELRLSNPKDFNRAFFLDPEVHFFLKNLWDPRKGFIKKLMDQGVPEEIAFLISAAASGK